MIKENEADKVSIKEKHHREEEHNKYVNNICAGDWIWAKDLVNDSLCNFLTAK